MDKSGIKDLPVIKLLINEEEYKCPYGIIVEISKTTRVHVACINSETFKKLEFNFEKKDIVEMFKSANNAFLIHAKVKYGTTEEVLDVYIYLDFYGVKLGKPTASLMKQLNPVSHFGQFDYVPSPEDERTLERNLMANGNALSSYIRFLETHCMGRKQFKKFIRNHKQFPSFLAHLNGHHAFSVEVIAETFKRIHTCRACGRMAYNKCGECLAYYYCDIDCQERDWPQHQYNCHTWKQDLYFLRLQPPIQECFEARYKKPVVSFNTFMKMTKRKCYQVTYKKDSL